MCLSSNMTLRLPSPLTLDLKVTLTITHDPNLKVALTLLLAKAILDLKFALICHHGGLPML